MRTIKEIKHNSTNISMVADNIKKECNIDKIIEQIGIKEIKFAIKNADKVMKDKEDKIISNGYIY